MDRERTLVAGAAGVVAVALLVAAVVPGVIADPTADLTRPGRVDIAEVAIAPGTVSGRTAELHVETRLRHEGNPARNVTVRFRAVDAESGLVATTRTVEVGDLTEDGERAVNATLRVEREGGYRVQTTVFRDDERVASGSTTVQGLEALTPAYARTGVAFTESEVLPPVSVSVADVSEDRTTLRVETALTNRDDVPSENLRVTLVVRQAESRLVADRASIDVGAIRPGRTATVDAEVTVPSEYNYYIDAVLWKDDVVVDSASGVANLDPTKRIRANETEAEVELDVSDFVTEGTGGSPQPTQRGEATGIDTPGFGIPVAVLALLAGALFAKRWSK